MRTLKKLTFTILTLSMLFGCKEKQTVEVDTPAEIKASKEKVPDIADVEFVDGMTGKLWHNYLEIKMALADGDDDQVQQTADSMAESLDKDMERSKALALELSETEDIEAQRKIFSSLTEELGPVFEKALSGGTIYKKHCPMAFNNKGAYWYADIEELSNPYFGEKMPKCGSVEKTIKK